MDGSKRARQLFDRWKTTLAKKSSSERETKKAQINFDELFYELSINQVDFEAAEEILPDAIAAHMPSHMLIEKIWHTQKTLLIGLNKKDWIDGWRDRIEESAKAAFYTWYKIPGEEEPTQAGTGNMSPQEYAMQRRYADSFPTMSQAELDEIDQRRRKFMEEFQDDLIFDEQRPLDDKDPR